MIAIGPYASIYVADQGLFRIVKLSLDGRALMTWGSKGNADGQFADDASVAVDPSSNKVYVANPINSQIQVFDAGGKLLTKRSVPEWRHVSGLGGVEIDSQTGRLCA